MIVESTTTTVLIVYSVTFHCHMPMRPINQPNDKQSNAPIQQCVDVCGWPSLFGYCTALCIIDRHRHHTLPQTTQQHSSVLTHSLVGCDVPTVNVLHCRPAISAARI
jgi:hypothetical protein